MKTGSALSAAYTVVLLPLTRNKNRKSAKRHCVVNWMIPIKVKTNWNTSQYSEKLPLSGKDGRKYYDVKKLISFLESDKCTLRDSYRKYIEQIFLYEISGNSDNNVTEESQHTPANTTVICVNENASLHHISSTSNSNKTINMHKSLILVCAECGSDQARYRTSKLYGSPSKIFTELSGTAKKNILSNVM